MKHLLHRCALLIVLCLSGLACVQAADERWVRSLHGTGIATSAALGVHDPAWGEMLSDPAHASYRKAEALVRLRFDDSRRQDFANDWSITVHYTLTLRKIDGTVIPAPGTPSSLTIGFDHDDTYQDIAVDVRNEVAWATLQVTSVVKTGISTVPDDVYLDLELGVDRFYVLTSIEAPKFLPPAGGLAVNAEQGLPLHWTYVEGAVSYDLEWVFVDATDPNAGLAYDMADATRVNVTGNSYVIPMAYPSGVVLFRVRGVGLTSVSGLRSEGAWEGPPTSGSTTGSGATEFRFLWNGLEDQRTWQYTASYAEQGKRTDQLTFFDRTMRARQSLTMLNTDGTTMLSEQFYDHLGRPSLRVMPYPVLGRSFAFHPDQALISGTTHYGVADYDTDVTISAPQTFPDAGAGTYYSPSGPMMGVHGALTPDAQGRPYARTTYWNDGTGRVKERGNVGSYLGVGSGHTTRTFYGTPGSQYELDRLFGNEVGWVQQYRKSFQVDPNGVSHVTYSDPQGRTIATALAGDPPETMEPIDTWSPDLVQEVTTDLGPRNQMDANGAWTVNSTIVIPSATDVTLTYALTGAEYEECITRPCEYDLRLCVFDESGDSLDINGPASGYCLTRTEVTDVSSFTHTFSMQAGVFTVQKVLSLHEASIVRNHQDFLDHMPPCVDPPLPVPVDCGGDCDATCEAAFYRIVDGSTFFLDEEGDILGLATVGASNYSANLAHVNSLIAACKKACTTMVTPPSICQQQFEALSADMSPGGQYFDDLPNELDPAYDHDRWLKERFWPDGPSTAWTNAGMRDADNNLITSWAGVRANWDPAWLNDFPGPAAGGLLDSHPEYCAFQHYCEPDCGGSPRSWIGSFYGGYHDLFYSQAVLTPPLTLDAPSHPQYALFNPLVEPQVTSTADPAAYQPAFAIVGDHVVDCWMDEIGTTCPDVDIAEALHHYYPANGVSGPPYYSVWYVLGDPDGISTNNGALVSVPPAVRAFFDELHGNCLNCDNGRIGNGAGQIPQFVAFRAIYTFYRELYAYRAYGCTDQTDRCTPFLESPNGDGLSAEGYLIRYPRNILFDNHPALLSDPEAFINGQFLLPSCEQACADAADGWMAQAAGCIPDEDEACVRGLLIDICSYGCAANTPMGSAEGDGVRSVNRCDGGLGTLMYTFEDVLALYGTDCPAITYPPVVPPTEPCRCARLIGFLAALGYEDLDDIDGPEDYAFILAALLELDGDIATTLSINPAHPAELQPILNGWLSTCGAGTVPAGLPSVFACPEVPDCAAEAGALADWNQGQEHMQTLEAAATAFDQGYRAHCFSAMDERETFTMSYSLNEYHYTLYYYDQAGNLVKTVPPQGVHLDLGLYQLDSDYDRNPDGWSTSWSSIAELTAATEAHRAAPETQPFIYPGHVMATWNLYNSFQRPVIRYTPDGGELHTWYDRAGRVVAEQPSSWEMKWTYVLYDQLGRPEESGETGGDAPTEDIARGVHPSYPGGIRDFIVGRDRHEVVRTYYDSPISPDINARFGAVGQQHLQGRVASTTYEWYQEASEGSELDYDQATHYGYDIHGNVAVLQQEIDELEDLGQDFKRMDYDYDLVSGHVNTVHYQTGQWDEFHHRYRYDADNRLRDVYTSTNGHLWDRDARYSYYAHGPLARTELGRKQVQGLDRTYTLQGWLRGVNAASLSAADDPGHDGEATGLNTHFAQDAFAFGLNYGLNDYEAIGGMSAMRHLPNLNGSYGTSILDHELFNGNIPGMITALRKAGSHGGNFDPLPLLANAYTYDVLNRIKGQAVHKGVTADGPDADDRIELLNLIDDGDYANTFHYDGNGNLTAMMKNGGPDGSPIGAQAMDDLEYVYHPSMWDLGPSNRLAYVNDNISAAGSGNFTNDIEQQPLENYSYTPNGNLEYDESAGTTFIWNRINKVRWVVREASSLSNLRFKYGPAGHRTVKVVQPRSSPGILILPQHEWEYTYYIHDAQGNPMAIYRRTRPHRPGGGEDDYIDRLQQIEVPLYGSDRLGGWATAREYEGTFSASLGPTEEDYGEMFTDVDYDPLPPADNGLGTYPLSLHQTLGEKRFELKNHLGNVLSVISDRTVAEDGDNNDVAERYLPRQLSQQYYYPFGDPMPMGDLASSPYRFGFQGQEKDDELHGATGTSYAFEYRMHDPRLGRFLSIDPLTAKYPYWSPYSFSGNRVIDMIELEGLEPKAPVGKWNIWFDNTYDHPLIGGRTVFEVSDPGSSERWHVARYDHGNGKIGWMYYNTNLPSGDRWRNFPAAGAADPVPAPRYAMVFQDTDPYVEPGICHGCLFADMMSRGMLNIAMSFSTLGLGTGVSLGASYFRAKGFDATKSLIMEGVVNNWDWAAMDYADPVFELLPAGLKTTAQSNIDFTGAGLSATFLTGNRHKSAYQAAFEASISLMGDGAKSQLKHFPAPTGLYTNTESLDGNPIFEFIIDIPLKLIENEKKKTME